MQTMPLAPGDYIFTGNGSHPVTFAFAYPALLDQKLLKQSLGVLLEHFPLLQSTLRKHSEHSYHFEQTEEKLLFEVVESTEAFEQIQDRLSLIRFAKSVEGEPLTRITLTQTSHGSILGVSISHALVDGFSYFQVLASWARCAQGKRVMPSYSNRVIFIPELPPEAHNLTPREVFDQCGIFLENQRNELPPGMPAEERVFLSKAEIKALITEAQQDINTVFFENDVLTAWLWKHYGLQWWAGQGNPDVYITCPVDFRRTLRGEQRLYFGCALCFATAASSFDILERASLGEIAQRIRKAVGYVKPESVEKRLMMLETLRHQHGISALQNIHIRHPQHGMIVTNLTRLPLAQLDFGSGPPTAFQAYTQIIPSAAILAASDGVEIRVFLPLPT